MGVKSAAKTAGINIFQLFIFFLHMCYIFSSQSILLRSRTALCRQAASTRSRKIKADAQQDPWDRSPHLFLWLL